MVIYNDIYQWEGWGGALRLQSGRCRLRIIDLRNIPAKEISLIKPFIVMVSEVPLDKTTRQFVSLRSCIGHVATRILREFELQRQRVLWVEYYPERRYGPKRDKVISERFDEVVFKWKDDVALQPSWKPVEPPLLDRLKELEKGSRPQAG